MENSTTSSRAYLDETRNKVNKGNKLLPSKMFVSGHTHKADALRQNGATVNSIQRSQTSRLDTMKRQFNKKLIQKPTSSKILASTSGRTNSSVPSSSVDLRSNDHLVSLHAVLFCFKLVSLL